ncbi:MAG TPA: response regulator transcription factor [Gemmatimonadales bacterium]|nr:response regulator transcription factor [Gemmatimonadales bacterium]
MKILLVEDEAASRAMLQAVLKAGGHEVAVAENGSEGWGLWQVAQQRVVVADWLMPEMDGLTLCKRIRAHRGASYTYFILETVRTGTGSFLEAMAAGVDDFISKPIVPDELLARLKVGERILGLRHELLTLEGLLAICSYCKRLRDEGGTWIPLERYVAARSGAKFSHGICPDCYETRVRPQLDEWQP